MRSNRQQGKRSQRLRPAYNASTEVFDTDRLHSGGDLTQATARAKDMLLQARCIVMHPSHLINPLLSRGLALHLRSDGVGLQNSLVVVPKLSRRV